MFVFDVTVTYMSEKFKTRYRNKYTVISKDDKEARQKAVALFEKASDPGSTEYSVLYCEVEHIRDISND